MVGLGKGFVGQDVERTADVRRSILEGEPMAELTERIGYDELLAARVAQLKEIEYRLYEITNKYQLYYGAEAMVLRLRMDIADMIRIAEAEHAAF